MSVAFQDFSDTLLSDKYFQMFHSSDFFFAIFSLLIRSYRDISYQLPIFSLLDCHGILFFWLANFSPALLTITPFLVHI